MPHGKGVLRVGRKGWSMTDIDAIRRKHEAQVAYTKEKQGNFPYLFQSIQSNLRISDVDALFAALDFDAYRSLSVGEKRNKINAPH